MPRHFVCQGTEISYHDGRVSGFWCSTGRKWTNTSIQLQMRIVFQAKASITQKQFKGPPGCHCHPRPREQGVGSPSWWSWRTDHRAKEDCSQALKSNGILPCYVLDSFDIRDPFLPVSPFWNGNV